MTYNATNVIYATGYMRFDTVTNNKIHDLYPSTNSSTTYSIYLNLTSSTTLSRENIITGNDIYDMKNTSGTYYGIYVSYSRKSDISSNKVRNHNSTASGSMQYYLYINYGDSSTFNSNLTYDNIYAYRVQAITFYYPYYSTANANKVYNITIVNGGTYTSNHQVQSILYLLFLVRYI
jgi:hypothetical protein